MCLVQIKEESLPPLNTSQKPWVFWLGSHIRPSWGPVPIRWTGQEIPAESRSLLFAMDAWSGFQGFQKNHRVFFGGKLPSKDVNQLMKNSVAQHSETLLALALFGAWSQAEIQVLMRRCFENTCDIVDASDSGERKMAGSFLVPVYHFDSTSKKS